MVPTKEDAVARLANQVPRLVKAAAIGAANAGSALDSNRDGESSKTTM